MRKARIRIVMALARFLRVPVDVHAAFFRPAKKEASTSGCSIGPK